MNPLNVIIDLEGDFISLTKIIWRYNSYNLKKNIIILLWNKKLGLENKLAWTQFA